jgi:hypothetical protein
MEAIDAEVLATLEDDILRPSVIERAVALALEELGPERDRTYHEQVAVEIAEIDRECRELTAAITAGGVLDVLVGHVDRLRALQERRKALHAQTTTRRTSCSPMANTALEPLREKLADWRGLLTRDVASGREVLRTLLVGPLRFTPVTAFDHRGYQFSGAIALDRLINGVVTIENTRWRGVPDGIRHVV